MIPVNCVIRRAFSTSLTKIQLPDLPYDYNALEPVISADIMKLHHQKHHLAYVNNYNIALEKLSGATSSGNTSQVVALQSAIKFNGGGHVNHSIFWKNLCPKMSYSEPDGALHHLIKSRFGSLDGLKTEMSAKTAAVQGSGWGWLVYSKEAQGLTVVTTANQDPVSLMFPGAVALLGIDVWEHAYYLQYKNARPDYLKAIWEVVNWKDVQERLAAAQC